MSVVYSGDKITFADSSVQSSAPIGFKNRIINGDMRIDQRNAGASGTAQAYTVDRWVTYFNQNSKFTWQQNAGSVTPPIGFTNYLGATSSSAYSVTSTDYFVFEQPIEGLNIADLGWGTANAKTVTLSFWVYSSLTGTFGGSLQNNAQTRSYPFSYTISSANTWEQKSITIAGDTTGTWLTTNGVGIRLNLSFGAGSSVSGTAGSWAASNYWSATGATSVVGTSGATFYITGVQLEVGSTASAFEVRDYGRELQMCQRYFQTVTATYTGSSVSGSNNGCMGKFLQTMRTAPTVTWLSNVGSLNFPTSSLSAYYFSATTQNFYPYRAASATSQDSRYTDNYTASAEL